MSSEDGASPVELALGVMVLVVPVAIMVLSIAPVFEHRNFARRAAAEAARTMVLTTGDPTSEALDLVNAQAIGMGIDPDNVTVELCGGAGCEVARGSVVTVGVSVVVEQLSAFLPIGSITVHETHSEQVDMFRSRP